MDIVRPAIAGTLESRDCQVTVLKQQFTALYYRRNIYHGEGISDEQSEQKKTEKNNDVSECSETGTYQRSIHL